jgi:hypothetical protein
MPVSSSQCTCCRRSPIYTSKFFNPAPTGRLPIKAPPITLARSSQCDPHACLKKCSVAYGLRHTYSHVSVCSCLFTRNKASPGGRFCSCSTDKSLSQIICLTGIDCRTNGILMPFVRLHWGKHKVVHAISHPGQQVKGIGRLVYYLT